jgi:hypothetical protein
MPPSSKQTDCSQSFIRYLQFVSDMLGGDLFPLEKEGHDISKLVSHRAIDYELIRAIVKEIQLHNAAFYLSDKLQAYPTLDALGKLRGKLLQNKGDIHQISLIDRIGELSVSFFNLSPETEDINNSQPPGRVYRLKRS